MLRLELERRPEHSSTMAVVSPLLAIILTLITGAILFAALGHDPAAALYVYFVEPLTSAWSLEELVVKATPLVLIGVGLSVCYRANAWNIGAEGQLTIGALCGSIPPILFPEWQNGLVLPVMIILAVVGGMAYAAIPAFLRIRFGTNEILTSLMLVYVAKLLLDWLVRGPWRDPEGFNFPESRLFSDAATFPALIADSRLHLGALLAVVIVVVAAFLLQKSLKGFEIKVIGASPRAAGFAGFNTKRAIMFSFLVAGGLAGLAGIAEVAGTIGQLRPIISPDYGFTAIIVAFLGRLHPIGILFAGVLLALSYLGGEAAQVTLGISDKIARVFQGVLLFFILACDTLIYYRFRLVRHHHDAGAKHVRT